MNVDPRLQKASDRLQRASLKLRRVSSLTQVAYQWIRIFVLTIRFRLLLLVFVSVILPTAFSGYTAYRQLHNKIDEKIRNDLFARADNQGARIDGWLKDRLAEADANVKALTILKEEIPALLAGARHPGHAKARSDLRKYLANLLEDEKQAFKPVKREPNHRAHALLDARGNLLLDWPDKSFIALSVEAGREAVVAHPPGSGSRIFILRQLKGQTGTPSVFLAAELNPDPLLNLMEDTGADPSGYLAYIVDGAGRLVAGREDGRGLELATGDFARVAARENPDQVADFVGITGALVTGTSRPLILRPWRMVMEIPRGKEEKALAKFGWQMLGFILLFCFVLIFGALFLLRTIIPPLEEMLRVSRQIREGNPGVEVVTTLGRGEMADLVKSFNSMSRSLKLSMESLKESNEKLREQSITDPLTGCRNRRYIMDTLDLALKQAKRFAHTLSLIMVDIDHFKKFNDRYGHLAGDEALKELSKILAINIRDSDVMARIGGEEFLISLPQTDKPGALCLAEKLREAVESARFQARDQKARLTISLGVATYEEDGKTLGELLDAADVALYQAKELGRDRVAAFSAQNPPGSSPSGRSHP